MEIELPEGWRLGHMFYSEEAQCNQVTLFYKNQWSDKLVVDKSLQESANAAIANPNARVYPILFKEGKLDLTHHKCDKGIWKLIDSGLITPKQGYEILPTANFIRTAKRKGVWDESWKQKSTVKPVEYNYNGRTYIRTSGSWYDITDGEPKALPKRIAFRSIWDARVKLGRGQCSIEDVAGYSLTAVLECAADLVACNVKEGDTVYKDITSKLEAAMEKPILCGFNQYKLPIFQFSMSKTSMRWIEFLELLRSVCDLKCSGYEARLRYTNGYNVTIQLEHARFKKAVQALRRDGSPRKLLHLPFLRHMTDKLNEMSLSDARDYVQEKYSEFYSICPSSEALRLVFFHHSGYYYGLWLDSGKIFRKRVTVGSWSIPFGFDKIPEDKRREILGEAFDYVDDEWCAQAKKARRSYFYFTRVVHMSYKRARHIVAHKHLRTNYDQLDWELKVEKFSCSEVNKTAKPITLMIRTERMVA